MAGKASSKNETKHDRFLRLMQRRLERALEELRLVSQLYSPNYEHTPEEALEVVQLLDEAVRNIARLSDVEYATRIGKTASQTSAGAQPISGFARKASILDEIEIVRALEHLREGRIEEVDRILRGAIIRQAA